MPKKSGFTLIELLVVITIIATLTTIGLVIYTSAQKSGRTAKRIQDLKAIQTALEIYYSANKAYPNPGGGWRGDCDHPWGTANLSPNDIIPGLIPNYMAGFPSDPAMDKANHRSCYLYQSNGTDYKLLDHDIAEFNQADYLVHKELIDPLRDNVDGNCAGESSAPANIWSWAVYSSETSRCW